jgi:hypothetical protein
MIRFACFSVDSIRIIDGEPVDGFLSYDPRHPDETTPSVLHVGPHRAELIEGGQSIEFRREPSRIPGLMSARGLPKLRLLVPLVCDDTYDSDDVSSYLAIEKPEQLGPYPPEVMRQIEESGIELPVYKDDDFFLWLLTEVRREPDPEGGRDEVYLARYVIRPNTGETERAYYSERYDYEYIVDATGCSGRSFDSHYRRLGVGDFIAYPILEWRHTVS